MILSILQELEANNSRNFKIELLTKHKDNELLKEVCRLANDPFTQFYQRKIPEYTPLDDFPTFILDYAIERLSILSTRTLTGNAAVAHLHTLLSSVTPEDAKVIERIIQKDLKCGVNTSTINKVWKNLIPEFPCMLCSPFEQKLVDKIVFPAIVQKKEDGMRFNAIVKFDDDFYGTVEFRSRNGKEITLLGNLEQEFIDLAYGKDLVFDGELLVYDTMETDSKGNICDRQTGNGILNKAVKGTISKEESNRVVATLWDQIPYEDFIAGKCDQPYTYRFKRLLYLIDRCDVYRKIELVETFDVHSLEQTQTIFQNYLDDGDEGIILKDPNSLWENKRSKGQIKFKAELDCDLKVVSVIGGTGKYADAIGSLYCESTDGVVKVYVGSGFNDEQRSAPPSDYYDKIIAVKYNARIKNVQGEESLFLPIFLEVRNDKETADMSNKIK
jgi:ATP-dependent DNA ligase